MHSILGGTLKSNILNDKITKFNCANKLLLDVHNESFYYKNDNSSNLILEIVSLNHNKLDIIYDKLLMKLTALEILQLHNNSITKIGMEDFKYNTKLRIIVLTLNRITNFDFDIVTLKSLRVLELNINLLTSLEEHAFYSMAYGNRSNVEIYVACNNFTCNCAYNWIFKSKYNKGMSIKLNNNNETCPNIDYRKCNETCINVDYRSHALELCSNISHCTNG